MPSFESAITEAEKKELQELREKSRKQSQKPENKQVMETEQPKDVKKRKVSGKLTNLGAGSYIGGEDVPVGLYNVTTASGESGNFVVKGDHLYNEILGSGYGVSRVRTQISKGDDIQISGLSSVTFTPVTEEFVTSHTLTNLYAGTFVVGEDISAGKYVATTTGGDSGNFVVRGSRLVNEILGSGYGVPSVNVTLSDGDFISISGLEQVIMTPR